MFFAEKFLVKVMATKKLANCSTFNELRVQQHHQSMANQFVDLPCTSSASNGVTFKQDCGMKLYLGMQVI